MLQPAQRYSTASGPFGPDLTQLLDGALAVGDVPDLLGDLADEVLGVRGVVEHARVHEQDRHSRADELSTPWRRAGILTVGALPTEGSLT